MPVILDIGNTSITYGLYDGGRLHASGYCLYNDIPKLFKNWQKSGKYNLSDVVICSVVPKVTPKVINRLPKEKGRKIWIVGKNLSIEFPHKYKPFDKLGKDRAVNIYGALRMYKAPFLVLDFGTAIKADYVSAKGVYEGGMIIPGPEIAFQALTERAALLPKKMRLPKTSASFLGTNTYDCMNAGILEGYGAMADGLIARFKEKYGNDLRVIVTGGFATHLKPFTRSMDNVDPLHPLKSLLILFKSTINKR